MWRVVEGVRESLGIDLARFPEHVGGLHLSFANPLLRRMNRSVTADERTLSALLRAGESKRRRLRNRAHERVATRWEWVPRAPRHPGAVLRSAHARAAAPTARSDLRPKRPVHRRAERRLCPGGEHRAGHHDEAADHLRVPGRNAAADVRRPGGLVRPEPEASSPCTNTAPASRGSAAGTRARRPCRSTSVPLFSRRRHLVSRGTRGCPRARGRRSRALRDVVDPYLSASDVQAVVPFIRDQRCPVRLLSSREFLHKRDSEGRTHEPALAAAVDDLQRQLRLPIAVRQMGGKERSPVHDCVVVVDENVYLLGSSLSEYGSQQRPSFVCRIRASFWRRSTLGGSPGHPWTRHLADAPSGRELRRLREQIGAAAKTAGDAFRLARKAASEHAREMGR